MTEVIVQLLEDIDATAFYGVNNINIRILKDLFPNVKFVARGRMIKLIGKDTEVENLVNIINILMRKVANTNKLTEDEIVDIIKGNEVKTIDDDNLIIHGVSGKSICARTPNQQLLFKKYADNDLLFAIGPAGSGKTYTAIALAVKALKNKEVKKIILSRPAVEAGEKLGFLPGDMKEKIDPYLQPLYDALQDMIPANKLAEYMSTNVIQIAPLAFMRGRTLADAVIVLDEAQNTTIEQIKMFLTRMGLGSKMIITGDLTQIDLPNSQKSGLKDALNVLNGIKGIAVIEFNKKDIVRHKLVQRIVEAYENRKHSIE
ncbi:MAG: PhoH family protein [Bacteroidales bacterium]|nr:PhoH family protein [Bacteroidales bacterium]MDD5974754.1 PhoH family protein [Bacteroidales bacterium]MDY5194461.1 PhoH family protein [Candidatus Aphodosoma sp.]